MPRKTMQTPQPQAPHLRIRLEPELLAKVEKARRGTGRTVTGEIAHRLERSFTDERNFATGSEHAAEHLEMAAIALPHIPPEQLATYVNALVVSLRRIAAQLREEPEKYHEQLARFQRGA
jgi:hypothetical protein